MPTVQEIVLAAGALLLEFLPLIILLTVSITLTVRDPRRVKCAIWWGLTLLYLGASAFTLFGKWMGHQQETVQAVTLFALAIGMLVSILLLSVLLILGGVRLIRRESLSVSHSLALALGVGILLYLLAFPASIFTDALPALATLFLMGLPLGYLAFVLVSYFLYSRAYGWWAKRFAPTPNAVVVLGAGLAGDKVTPLLAARINLGIRMYEDAKAAGADPLFVTSGGQGRGETIPEGVAMGLYAREKGVPAVVEETKSVSTETNLEYTAEVLDWGHEPWMVTTSDYHALRAAILMRELHIEGNAVGAKTPLYFWSAAFLREYVAMLRRHWVLNAAMLAAACVPLLFGILSWMSTLH